MIDRPLLVLSLEGLATSALGCYGSSWNQTPAIDAVAASGCVWDRWISTTDDPNAYLRQTFADRGADWASPWRRRGTVELITDTPAAADSVAVFDKVVALEQPPTDPDERPQSEIAATQLGQLVAACIERDLQEDPWSVLWLHSSFLARRWDAPRELFPWDDDDEESNGPDEEVELLETETIQTLERLPAIFETVIPPQLRLGKAPHPDLINSWMRTYGCQVRLVDLMIEVLLQSLSTEDPRVLIVATSGFSLGQNGWIGHQQGPLRSADIRLPMILSDVAPIRIPQLTPSNALSGILADLGQGQTPWLSPQHWGLDDVDTTIPTESQRAEFAVTTADWFYARDKDASEHLFLKPDDGDDFNDVGRLRRDVVARLREQK